MVSRVNPRAGRNLCSPLHTLCFRKIVSQSALVAMTKYRRLCGLHHRDFSLIVLESGSTGLECYSIGSAAGERSLATTCHVLTWPSLHVCTQREISFCLSSSFFFFNDSLLELKLLPLWPPLIPISGLQALSSCRVAWGLGHQLSFGVGGETKCMQEDVSASN